MARSCSHGSPRDHGAAAWTCVGLPAVMTTSTTTSRKTNTINSSPFMATKPASLCPVPRPPWPNTKRPRRSTRRRSPLSKRISSSCSLPAGCSKAMGRGNQSALVGNPESHCSSPAQTQPVAETRRSSTVARMAVCSLRNWFPTKPLSY